MTDIAALGIAIDSDSAGTAVSRLDALTTSAGRAERASDGLAVGSGRAAQALQGAAAATDRSRTTTTAATRELDRARAAFTNLVQSGLLSASVLTSQGAGFRAAATEAERMRRATRDLDGALSGAAAAGVDMEESVAALAGSLRPMIALGGAWVALRVGQSLLDLGAAAARAADDHEKFVAQLEFSAGSQARAADEMARAAVMADRLGVAERGVHDARAAFLAMEQRGEIGRRNSLAMTESLIAAQRFWGAEAVKSSGFMAAFEAAMSNVNVSMERYEALAASLPGLAPRLEAEIRSMAGTGARDIDELTRSGDLTREMLADALPDALGVFEAKSTTALSRVSAEMARLRDEWNTFLAGIGQSRFIQQPLKGAGVLIDAGGDVIGGINKAVGFTPLGAAEQAAALAAEVAAAEDRLRGARTQLQDALALAARQGWDPTQDDGAQGLQAAADAAQAALEATLSRVALAESESAIRAGQVDLEEMADVASAARARLRAADAETEASQREAAYVALAARERELAQWRQEGYGDAEALSRIEAQIAADRAKLDEAGKPKNARDQAAEAEAARNHAQAMLAAAKLEGEAARRREEIRLLSEQAASRTGYDPASAEFARARDAEAARLRADDERQKLETDRREAEQLARRSAAEAERESKRLSDEQTRHREAAQERMRALDAEAAQASAALGVSQAAAAQAASASTIEAIQRIEAEAEASRRRLAVQEAGQKAYEALDKGATQTERDAARAQAEATERAKQQVQIEERKLQTAATLLGLRQEEARGAEAAARAAGTAAAAVGAQSSAEIAALEARDAAAARTAETEQKAAEARLSLGAEAGKLERDAAEAAARGLAAEEERLRVAGLLLDQARALAELRERGAQAEARAAVSLRHAAAASAARTTLELEAARKSAEAETRQLDRAERIKAAGESLGPEADPIRVREAERLAAAEWGRTEAARQAGEFIERRANLLRFEETAANRLADIEAQRAAYLAADGTAEERARAAQLELTVQQRIREAKAQQLPHDEAALRAGAEREASAARELDLIQRRGAALEDLGRRSKQAAEDAAAARQGPAAQTALSIRRAGEDAARPLGDDPTVAAAAEDEARARLHAEAVRDLQSRLMGLQTPYAQALEAADRWREGALANLDPMAAGYAEFADEVEQVTARMYEDALQHSTDYFDGVRRGLKDLEEANRDWAKTAEGFTTGFAKTSEDAFVNLAKTGKFEIGSLADFVIEQMARMAYQQAIAPAVNGVAGGIANLLGSFLGGSFGGGAGAANAAAGSVKGYDAGGFTGAGAKYEPAGIVHRGEYVFDAETTARLFPLLEALHRSKGRLPGYAEGGAVGFRAAPLFAAPPAAQIEALTRAAGQGASAAPMAVNVVIVNETSAPIGRAERRQRSDGSIEIRLKEIAVSAVSESIATGGTAAQAISGRFQVPQNFGGRR